MSMLCEAHIFRIYDQGADAVVHLVNKLLDRIEEMETRLIYSPQPLIARHSKELAQLKRMLARASIRSCLSSTSSIRTRQKTKTTAVT
jgi:hypothetical protein